MASLQQVVEQLALLLATGSNGTGPANATFPTSSGPRGPLDVVTSTFGVLFSASALRDWAILLVIGSFFETARRFLSSLWYWLINSFFITAVFEDDDISFQWIMHWMSEQPSWKGARNVQISTSNFDLHAMQVYTEESLDARKVAYLPVVSESYTLWYKYRWMRVSRAVESYRGGWATRERLTISIMTRDQSLLMDILQDAQNGYAEAKKDRITIFVSESSSNSWRELATRPKRPLNSIILDPGITEFVAADVQDFLGSKEWYAERGIPFRRGYLLYGAPGSGKTSLIHSIAGELGLNVYILSLSRSGLDDTSLAELISALPERCIALMEDIDAAFHHGLSRESPQATPSTQTSDHPDQQRDGQSSGPPAPSSNRVSLSGLLNALDGIGAQEGRVLFATTNKYNALDPALCRPGRMDLHIEFKLASQFQAEELFKRFYAPSASAGATETKDATTMTMTTTTTEKRVNGHAGMHDKDLIDLSESHAPASSMSSSPSSLSPSLTPSMSEKTDKTDESDPVPGPSFVGVSHRERAPRLSMDRIDALAAQFALAVPERQLSMASLQGFLMMHKARPFGAVSGVAAWVDKELSERKQVDKTDDGASAG